nr:MAG TPA: hypothetical protein [Caudoviricetes sp.]
MRITIHKIIIHLATSFIIILSRCSKLMCENPQKHPFS